jgi:regulatory protein
MTDEELQVMKSALRLLTRRPHSRRELIDKLMAREFRYPAVLAVIGECEKRGYLNDRQMAEDYAVELAARGHGDFKIKLKMRAKGLPAALIEEELAGLGETSPASERALQSLERKMPALNREPDPRKRREKAYRFLASRGFDGEAIRNAIDRMGDSDEYH